MNSDDAVEFQRLGLKSRQEDLLHCRILVGDAVMEGEEATSLFYTLANPLTQIDFKRNVKYLLKTRRFHGCHECVTENWRYDYSSTAEIKPLHWKVEVEVEIS